LSEELFGAAKDNVAGHLKWLAKENQVGKLIDSGFLD
jgi:hypothetical protein